jgi:hypothetical protein
MVRKRDRHSQPQPRGTRSETLELPQLGLQLDGYAAAERAQPAPQDSKAALAERASGSYVICLDLAGDDSED